MELRSSQQTRSAPLLGATSAAAAHEEMREEAAPRDRPRLRGIRSKKSSLVSGRGTWDGVWLPGVSSILGAVLFVRMSWSVGQAGWGGVLLMLSIGLFLNVMTALSLAAVSTNGTVKGGGVYFLLSRSLGPEFGVSVTVVYLISLVVAAAFALMAFAETFADTIICSTDPCRTFHLENEWLCTQIASLVLLVVFLTNLAPGGAAVMGRLSGWITLGIMAVIAFGVASLLASHGAAYISTSHLRENAWFNYTVVVDPQSGRENQQNFLTVFVILFPAMTGLGGLSCTGKLKDPADSIPKGVLGAISFTTVLYAVLVILFALSFSRHTLQTNRAVFRQSSFSPMTITSGILMCTLSAAMDSFIGAARLLQALSKDKLLKMFDLFAQGSAKDGEPQVALIPCFVIAQICLLYGKLDAIAALVTDSFLLVYVFLNLACFALRISGAPNFRPRFAYFSWHTALAGAVGSLLVIFVTSPLQGLFACCLIAAFAYYVHVKAPVVPWGDVSQALIYHQVRKYLLRLDVRRSHPKFWRPSILFLPHYEEGQLALLDFCNNLKKGGLYVVGNVLTCKPGESGVLHEMPNMMLVCERLKQLWLDLLDETRSKAFHEVILAPDIVTGARSLLMSAGLGGLRPNTVCLQFFRSKGEIGQENDAFVSSTMTLPGSRTHVHSAASSNALFDDTSHQGDSQFSEAAFVHRDQTTEGETLMAQKGFRSPKARVLMSEIHEVVSSFETEDENSHGAQPLSEMNYCEMLADGLVLEKNLLIARYFEHLSKQVIVDHRKRLRKRESSSRRSLFHSSSAFRFRFKTAAVGQASASRSVSFEDSDTSSEYSSMSLNENEPDGSDSPPFMSNQLSWMEEDEDRYTTIDLWSTDEDDWSDPCGTLALEMQLAFGLHRTDIWEEHTRLRVIAACESVTGAQGSEEAKAKARRAYETLWKLLRAIRVEAEIIVLPAVGAALFEAYSEEGEDGVEIRVQRNCRTEPLTQLEHCAELNAMVLEHSAEKACVVFLPLPRPPTHSRINKARSTEYLSNLRVLTQGLPPSILVAPGSNISPIVTTDL